MSQPISVQDTKTCAHEFLSYLENAENMFHKCDYSSLPIRLIVLPIATNRIAHRDYSLVFNV